MASGSPFPGMDPWLEAHWGDVHASIATYARDQLNERLGPGLIARMQERVYIESPLVERRTFSPDVHVYEAARKSPGPAAGSATAAVAQPYRLRLPAVEVREAYLEIRDARSGGPVITTIDIVSATNKTTKVGRRKYLQKQEEILESETNLVEIDLLCGGRRVTLAAPDLIPKEGQAPYHAVVRRPSKPDELEYYALPLRERLPAIRVPLRPADDDVPLDLQALIDDAYRKGRYAETIDYAKPPKPALDPDDAAWAAELVRARAS